MLREKLADDIACLARNKIAINLKRVPLQPGVWAAAQHRPPAGKLLGKLDDYLALNPKAFQPGSKIPERLKTLGERIRKRGEPDTADFFYDPKNRTGKAFDAEAMAWDSSSLKSSRAIAEVKQDVAQDVAKATQKIKDVATPSTDTKATAYLAAARATPLLVGASKLLDYKDLITSNPNFHTLSDLISRMF